MLKSENYMKFADTAVCDMCKKPLKSVINY